MNENKQNSPSAFLALPLGFNPDDKRKYTAKVVKKCTECPRGTETTVDNVVVCKDTGERMVSTDAWPIDSRCDRMFDANGHICILEPVEAEVEGGS